MFAQTPVSLAAPPRCNETPCSVRTRTQTALSPHGSLRLPLPEIHQSFGSRTPELRSPPRAQFDAKSVKVHHIPVSFRFNCEHGSSPMTFHIPTFHHQPQNLKFFQVTSAASFNYIPNAKAEFGDITNGDIKSGNPAISITLGGLNNLQLNKRLREERFDIFQKSDSKKIKKMTSKAKWCLDRQFRAEDSTVRTPEVGGNFSNNKPRKCQSWVSATPQSQFGTPLTPVTAIAKNRPPSIKITEFNFSAQPFQGILEVATAPSEKISTESFKFSLMRSGAETGISPQQQDTSADGDASHPPEKC